MTQKIKKKLLMLSIVLLLILLLFFLENIVCSFMKILYPLKYEETIYYYSQEFNVDPYLVCAIIKNESNFNPEAKSKKNAIGLMQITEKTAEWIAKKINLPYFKKEDLYNPDTNIMLGTWYLAYLIKYFDGNIKYAVAAYNAGLSNVNKWHAERLKNNDVDINIRFNETKLFLKGVFRSYEIYKKVYNNYFNNIYSY